MRLILEAGGDPNAPRQDGSTPLYAGAERGNVDVIRVLLSAGCEPNKATGKNLMLPLHIAAQNGNVQVVRDLLAAGGDPNGSMHDDCASPVVLATFKDHVEVLGVLLAAGGDPNKVQQDTVTPLIIATVNSKVQALRLLLDAWADTPTSYNGKTAMEIACTAMPLKWDVHLAIVRMLVYQPCAAARDLVASQQRLAIAACFAPGAQFALPDGVAALIAKIDLPNVDAREPTDGMHKLPLDAVYELPRFPLVATVRSSSSPSL